MEGVKNTSKVKLKAVIIAIALAIATVGTVLFTTQTKNNNTVASGNGNDKIADGSLEFQIINSSGQKVKIDNAPVGKDVTLHIALTTSAESHTGEDYVIKFDSDDFVINGLSKNGDVINLDSNGNKLTITRQDNNGAYDLVINGWTNGTTLSFNLDGHKKTANKTSVTMQVNEASHGGQLEADLTAYGDITYSNNKTVNHSKLSVSSNGENVKDENGNELTDKLTYILRGNYNIDNPSNVNVNGKIEVSDTLNIPAGINISDLDKLKEFLTVSGTGLTNDDITYTVTQQDGGSNNIRKLKISYTLDSANKINDFLYSDNYKINLDAASLIKQYGTSIAKGGSVDITNDLNSNYITDFVTITPAPSTATTTIEKDKGPVYSYDKKITNVNDGAKTEYVKLGDTITYQMVINNTGAEAGTIDYVDYIPAGTEFVSCEINNGASSGISNTTWAQDAGTNSVRGTSIINSNGKLVLNMKVKVTDETKASINNQFFDKNVSIPVKKMEDYTVEKTSDRGYIEITDTNKQIVYTIKVTNTGAGPIENKDITDTIPKGLDYKSADVGTNTDVTAKFENGVVTFSGITLQPGESKEFKITCELNGKMQGWIVNTAKFYEKEAWTGISLQAPFGFTKLVNKMENDERAEKPQSEIEANNGSKIEYTMVLENKQADYDLNANPIVMVDTIPSTINVDTANFYYTVGDNDTATLPKDNHYTADAKFETVDKGTKLTWTLNNINNETTFKKGQKVVLHIFGTVNTGKIDKQTTIKNTAEVPSIQQNSTATIKVNPLKETEMEKYIYKIFDENGNKIYENTKGTLETDQSKIPYVSENYTVVYRVKIKNTSGEVLNKLDLTENPETDGNLEIGTKYYNQADGTVINGTDPENDKNHIRINVYGNDGSYKGTFTTYGVGVYEQNGKQFWQNAKITSDDYSSASWNSYEITYKKGVDSNGFTLNPDETVTLEYSLVTSRKNFEKVTNTIINSVEKVNSETLYAKKTVNDIVKTVSLTPKTNVSTNQNFVDPLDILQSKLNDNYLIYKVTFNTKGWLNDELELKDTLDSHLSYVTDGVDGYNGLPVVLLTSQYDEWNKDTFVKDEDNDTTEEDTTPEYSVETNGNNMTIKIKPCQNRKKFYQSNFTVYYLVKSNFDDIPNTINAVNTASITYDNNTIQDPATVNIIKQKSYPGITKKYKGSYGDSTTETENDNPKLSSSANESSRLVWTFKITNDDAANAKEMNNYTISDVLPVGYEYDNVYSDDTNTGAKYYPSFTIVRSDGTKTTYSAKDKTYIEPTHSKITINNEERNVLTWNFTEDTYKLNPGDYIEFNISSKLPGNTARSSVATNDVYLIVNGDYETDSNDDVQTFDGKQALHAQDYITVGSANVTTSTKEVQIFEQGENGYDKASSAEADKNTIEAQVGKDIKYTLSIKNDSPEFVKNIMIIDRLPYVGDDYLTVASEGNKGRQSAFSIKYKNIESIKVYDKDGKEKQTLTSDQYKVDFSNYKDRISSDEPDWNKDATSNLKASWHDTYNSDDVNMRINISNDIKLDVDESIKVVFKAALPEEKNIESSGADKITWNNFAYTRKTENKLTGEESEGLVAESARVGIWVKKIETSISINKVWDDNNNFHGIRPSSIKVQVMKRKAGSNDQFVNYNDPITLSGEGNTWSTVIQSLPKYENGEEIEYTAVEVDENGNNAGNIDNYETQQPTETTDENGNKTVTITNKEITGKIEIEKIVKNRGKNVASTTDENFYFAIKDTTTNKYVLHDNNNKVSSYETINQLNTYSNLNNALWSINPAQNAKLDIDNLIFGRAYQIIETTKAGEIVTDTNTKYITTYNPATNTITDKETTYIYKVTNDLKLVNFEATKVWNDDSNKHNIRPTEITIQLYADGKPVDGKAVKISSANADQNDKNKWIYTFEDLRATDDNGNEITYTIREVEDLSSNYDSSISDATSETKTETRKDESNQDVQIQVKTIKQTITNTEKVGSLTVTKQVMNYGTDITSTANETYYFVVKQGDEGYVSSDGSVKKYKDSTCIFSIETGKDNSGNIKQPSKTISNLTYGKKYTVVETDKDGNAITENDVDYKVTYDPQVPDVTIDTDHKSGNAKIINTLNNTEKTATKIWVDNSNKHGVRPESVEIQLYADGQKQGEPVVLTSANIDKDINTWTYKFTNLKKYQDDGKTEINYTIVENNVDSHYAKQENGLTVTNTEQTGDISITKKVINNNVDITNQAEKTFNFLVEQYSGEKLDGYINQAGELVSAENKLQAIITIKTGANGDSNFSKKISGLPLEKKYKVIEVNTEGTELTKDNSEYIVSYDNNREMTINSSAKSAGTTVTNTLDTTSVTVNKVWSDNDGANGFRPDSIKVQLYADNVAQGDMVTLTSDTWSYTWENLKKYKDNGTDLVSYSVKEFDKNGNETIEHYILLSQSEQSNENGKTITLTNKEVLGGLTITKEILNTSGNTLTNIPDRFKGPYYVTIQRKDNGNYIDSDGAESEGIKTIALNGSTSVTIANIPLTTYKITETDKNGKPISEDGQFTSKFEIKYNDDNNQEITITDPAVPIIFKVKNKIIEKTKLDVSKVWVDENDLHGLRPDEIEIKLYKLGANGEKIDTNITKNLKKSDNWKTITFDNLDKYDENGNEITYTADEITVPDNYTKDVKQNENVVTITNTEEKQNLTVTKQYFDNKGNDITNSAEVTFHFIVEQLNGNTSEGYVKQDGSVGSDKTIFDIVVGPNKAPNKQISGLTKNRAYKVIETDENGNEITTDNSVFEVSYVNQTNTITNSNINSTIINKLKGTTLKISKKWVDNETHDLRNTIKATLKADGVVVGTYDLTKENGYSVTIDNLAEYRNDGITKVVYTVEEDSSTIGNYNQGSIEEIKDHEFVITNTEVTGTLKITKKLLNTKGEEIKNISDKISDQMYYVTVIRKTNNHYINSEGEEKVSEQLISLKANETITLTGLALDEYTVKEVDVDGNSTEKGFSILDTDGNTIKLVPSYDNQVVTLTKDKTEGQTIVKNKISDVIDVPIKKVWNDKGKNIEHRPEAITVVLYANSEIARDLDGNEMSVTLDNEDKVDDYNWAYTFKNLPKYDDNGNKITYTISEKDLKYTEAPMGAKSNIIDNETNKEKETTQEKAETASEGKANIQNNIIKKAPANGDGQNEAEAKFYNPTVDQTTLTITNTPVVNNEKVGLTIEKIWSGDEANTSHRPQSITFIIKRTDTNEEVRRVQLSAKTNWKYSCDDLLKYNNDLYEITYEVYEVVPNNDDFKFYDTTGVILVNGEKVKKASNVGNNEFKITNTFDVPDDKVKIEVTKLWTNLLDKYELTTPDSITINVKGSVDGTEISNTPYTIDKQTYQNQTGTTWKYVVEDLPKYDENGKEISYSVTEDEIKNFEQVSVDENYNGDVKYVTFTNKQLTGTLYITKTVFNKTETGEEKNISATMKQRYYFTVNCVDNGITYYLNSNGELSKEKVVLSVATGTNNAVQINNLLLDKQYTVIETNDKGEKLTDSNSDYIIAKGEDSVTLSLDKKDKQGNIIGNVELINKLQSKDIVITKNWNDQNNKYQKRPETIKFVLYKTVTGSGTSSVSSKVIEVNTQNCTVDGNTWKYELKNLPIVDDTGAAISYRIEEDQNGLEWYYLSDEQQTLRKNKDEYVFTNTEVVGQYSLQLSKIDEKGFAIGGMKFEINGEEKETTKDGKIIIAENKEISDDKDEIVKIKEISTQSEITNKKYIKLKDEIDLTIKKQRIDKECKVTGISLNGNDFSTEQVKIAELDNGAKITINAKLVGNNITIEIVNIEQSPDLSLKKFITKVDDKDISSQIPTFTSKSDGTYTYSKTDEVLSVEDNNLITYDIRVYNEGNIAQYADLVEDIIPQGLEFVEDNEINKAYGWTKVEDGKVRTSILSKENGENNLINPYLPETMDSPEYKDLLIVLKVVEPENSDRIVTNRAQIMKQVDKEGIDSDDIDSTPGKWIDGDDDQDLVSVKVKYFDLSLSKYITKVTTISDGKQETRETGYTAENNKKDVTKVDIKASKISNSIIKVEYGITIKNEGEIAGTAKEIVDYLPEGFKFDKNDNPDWDEKDGRIVTNKLENFMIEPGKSETVYITLTWDNSVGSIGIKKNYAEISVDYNESNTPDIDSVPGNKVLTEDDIDYADIMVTVKTGGIMYGINIAEIALAALSIMIVVTIRLKKKEQINN